MPVDFGFNVTITDDTKKGHFMNAFKNFITSDVVGNDLDDKVFKELMPIVKVDDSYLYKTLHALYNLRMGKWFNKPNPKSNDAKWLDKLGKDLKKHDDKYIPKYRKLKDKIEKVSKFNLPPNSNLYGKEMKQIKSVKEEAKKLFKDAWDDLKNILEKASKAVNKMPEIYEYKNGKSTEKYKNLVFACKEDIQNLVSALEYKPNEIDLYDQLGILGSSFEAKSEIIVSKSSDDKSQQVFSSRMDTFKMYLINNSICNKNFVPIVLKSIRDDFHATSISGRFSELFSEFINRGKGSKTSHTAKWCRSVLKDIQKHERDYVPKYERLRKEIKAMLASNPTQSEDEDENNNSKVKNWEKHTVKPLKQRAIKLFEDARKSLQGVLDRAAKSARRTLVINSTVYAKYDDVQNLADEFRKVKANEEELWKVLTKGKLN